MRLTNVPAFIKDKGDTITYSETNTMAITVFNKFNLLNSFDVDTIDTGKFVDYISYGLTKPILYANYCGRMMKQASTGSDEYTVVSEFSIDQAIDKEIDDINDILDRL